MKKILTLFLVLILLFPISAHAIEPYNGSGTWERYATEVVYDSANDRYVFKITSSEVNFYYVGIAADKDRKKILYSSDERVGSGNVFMRCNGYVQFSLYRQLNKGLISFNSYLLNQIKNPHPDCPKVDLPEPEPELEPTPAPSCADIVCACIRELKAVNEQILAELKDQNKKLDDLTAAVKKIDTESIVKAINDSNQKTEMWLKKIDDTLLAGNHQRNYTNDLLLKIKDNAIKTNDKLDYGNKTRDEIKEEIKKGVERIDTSIEKIHTSVEKIHTSVEKIGGGIDKIGDQFDTDKDYQINKPKDYSDLLDKHKPSERQKFEDNNIYFSDQGDADVPGKLPKIPDPVDNWDGIFREKEGKKEDELKKDEFDKDKELQKDKFDKDKELQKDKFDKDKELQKDKFDKDKELQKDKLDKDKELQKDKLDKDKEFQKDTFDKDDEFKKDAEMQRTNIFEKDKEMQVTN